MRNLNSLMELIGDDGEVNGFYYPQTTPISSSPPSLSSFIVPPSLELTPLNFKSKFKKEKFKFLYISK